MELKTDRMTRQERMEALYNYEKPDRVPMLFLANPLCMVNAGYNRKDMYTDTQKLFNAWHWTCQQYGWEPQPHNSPEVVLGSWNFGAKMKLPDSPFAMVVSVEEPGIKSEEDVVNLELPDPKTAGPIPERMEFARLQEKAGLKVSFTTRSPFTAATEACGIEQFCRWMIRKPDLCHRLVRMCMEHILEVLRYWVDTFGSERIDFFINSPSEANQIISPKQFKDFALPYHHEFFRKLDEMKIRRVLFHICGEQNLNLPYLAELASGADSWPHPAILSFGQEVELDTAAEHFPKDIIMGNIETGVIQAGTPQEVYELCRIVIEKGKKIPGGFILSASCSMPPSAPSYNVWMLTKAVNNFGWYE